MGEVNEEELLAKMEELNRSLQMDSKSVHKLSSLSRNNSVTSDLNLFGVNEEDKMSISSLGMSPVLNSDSKFLSKWDEIVKNFNSYAKRKNYLKDLMKQSGGIPSYYRPILWQFLSGCTDDNPISVKIRNNYPEYLKQQSPCERAIRRDIARTYPQHELFKDPDGDGQERLFKIMKAYSIYDREVGYCQGTGFIGGLLLIHMPEEDAFMVLVMMMSEYQLRHLYKPSMSELGLYMHQLDCLVEDHLPKLSSHFNSYNFTATVYASGWFLTLFTLPFSIDVASRVLDLFLIDGIEVIFKICLAYLMYCQEELLKLDMESMLRHLQSVASQQLDIDCSQLFETIATIKLNSRKMKKAEKEYLALKMEEEENQVELRRLRTENGLLLQRIDRLEKEIESLTQSLVNQKLKVAEQSSDISRYQQELVESKRQAENLRKNLNGTETQLQLAVNQLNGRFSVQRDTRKASLCDDYASLGSDLVQQLQTELVNVRLKEAETNAAYRDLKDKYQKVEEENKLLSKTPTEEVARLQEDLVALKLKEAETSLALKDSYKRLADLAKLYKNHIDKCPSNPTDSGTDHSLSSSSNQQSTLLQLARQVVESEHAAELSMLRQKLMQFEAQREITNRQITRRDGEMIDMRDKLSHQEQIRKELRVELQEADRRCVDLETKRKEDLMMWKIQRMELESQIAEMHQQIARIETEKVAETSFQQVGCNTESDLSSHSSSKNYHRHHYLDSYDQTKSNQSEFNDSYQSTSSVNATPPTANSKWKNLPTNIMTDSIGPIDELCFTPDDPMITSIYIHTANESTHNNNPVANNDSSTPLATTPTGEDDNNNDKSFFSNKNKYRNGRGDEDFE